MMQSQHTKVVIIHDQIMGILLSAIQVTNSTLEYFLMYINPIHGLYQNTYIFDTPLKSCNALVNPKSKNLT